MTPDLIKRRDEMAYFHMHDTSRYQRAEQSFKEGFDACFRLISKPINPSEIRILGMTMDELIIMREYFIRHGGELPKGSE